MYEILQSCCLGGKNYLKGEKVILSKDQLKDIAGSEKEMVKEIKEPKKT